MELAFIPGIPKLNEVTLTLFVETRKHISKKFTVFTIQVPVHSFHKVVSQK